MTFETMIDLVIENIGASFEWVVILILCLGTVIFAAKDFKLFIITLLGISAGLFVWFYEKSLDYRLPLAIFFIALVILTLSLTAVDKTSTTGGFV